VTTELAVVPPDANAALFTGEIHPYAAAFPMLPDADLDALAADIKSNGLLHPLVLTGDGTLLDGRNRLAACDRAGITPEFVIHDGDPVAFVVSVNMQRRDLTQAQKAHLVIAGLSESDNLRQEDLASVSGVSRSTVAEAAVVAKFTPEASAEVIAGQLTHADAYTAARALKDEQAQRDTQHATLTAEAPDILASGLPLPEAWAAYQKRTEKERIAAEQREAHIRDRSLKLIGALATIRQWAHDANRAEWIATYRPLQDMDDYTTADLRHTAERLQLLAKEWPK
jgi:ParB-like chromosome segregation protein Spo0J